MKPWIKPLLLLAALLVAAPATALAGEADLKLGTFTMHYREEGKGAQTVLLVHGFAGTHATWSALIKKIPTRQYRVIAIDLRGAGKSTVTDSGYSIDQAVADIEEFAKTKGLDKFTLIGHSLGGGIAASYALAHPERVNALVLVDPLATFGLAKLPKEAYDWFAGAQTTPQGKKAVVEGAFQKSKTGKLNVDAATVKAAMAAAETWGPAIWKGHLESMKSFDITKKVRAITAPTLIIYGKKDAVIPLDGITSYKQIPGSVEKVIDNASHSPQLETPAEFSKLVLEFLPKPAKPAKAPKAATLETQPIIWDGLPVPAISRSGFGRA
ncbi:MAG: alpha/beta fold hydrolase [Kofleriaceae bacterium]